MADGECWGSGCRDEAVQRREVGSEVEIRAEGCQESWCSLMIMIHLRGRERMSYSLELDRKPGILSPKALTFSKSQSVRISISKTFIVGNCNWGGVIMPSSSSSHNINTITDHYSK